MKLGEYINQFMGSKNQAALCLSVSYETIRKWITGERVPCPENMKKIFRWSNGQVAPADFYDVGGGE